MLFRPLSERGYTYIRARRVRQYNGHRCRDSFCDGEDESMKIQPSKEGTKDRASDGRLRKNHIILNKYG
jgi:hypothetical protein